MQKKLTFILIGGILIVGIIFLLSHLENIGVPLDNSSSSSIMVSTSFYPLYYFTSQIGGEKINVKNITPAGAEPHDYEPTTQDLASIEKSKLLILNGSNLEAWGNKIKDELESTHVEVVEAGTGLTTHQVEEEGQTIIDPHIWLNPLLAKQEVERITQALIKIDPPNQDYYQTNAGDLNRRLTELDQNYREGLKTCKKTEIITSHAAFNYLAEEYGLKQVPINGLSPDEEPSPQQLVHIAQFAKKNNIHYIFFESLVSPKLSQTIAEEIGAQTLVLNPLEGLNDEEISQGGSYFTEMKKNLTNLKIALACQ